MPYLLNSSSAWQLISISGTRSSDIRLTEHVVKILSKQRELDFKPGEKYAYSNSNYTLLAKIVEKVSGVHLRILHMMPFLNR